MARPMVDVPHSTDRSVYSAWTGDTSQQQQPKSPQWNSISLGISVSMISHEGIDVHLMGNKI